MLSTILIVPSCVEVDLGRVVQVTAVASQGRSDRGQWVESFALSYSQDGVTWYPYYEGRSKKVTEHESTVHVTI